MIDKVHHPHDVWINNYLDIEERWGRGQDLSISSLPTLNNKIWGLPKKKLVVIGARPSQGKSTVMLQMAWDFVQQGKKVYFFTFEMTKEDCIERLWSLDQEIDNFLIKTGKISTLSHLPTVQKQRDNFDKKINTNNFVLIEGYGKTFSEINDVIEGLGKEVDVVFIDYLQMIKEKTNSKVAIDEYIKDLRNCAITNNFCAVVGSQINRGSHDQHKIREPELWEMKGSGAIEEHADMCWLLHWQFFYDRDDLRKQDYLIKVAKNRGGRTGRFECRFIPEYYKIRELNDVELAEKTIR